MKYILISFLTFIAGILIYRYSSASNISTITPISILKPISIKSRLTIDEVNQLVEKVIYIYPRINPLMVRAIIEIESGRRAKVTRYEAHLNDSSIGLMQTLLSTAQDMAKNFGAREYGVPTYNDLMEPKKSIYFGVSYLNWLRRYGETEERLVRNYNGGTKGYLRDSTLNYWNKYKLAKRRLENE